MKKQIIRQAVIIAIFSFMAASILHNLVLNKANWLIFALFVAIPFGIGYYLGKTRISEEVNGTKVKIDSFCYFLLTGVTASFISGILLQSSDWMELSLNAVWGIGLAFFIFSFSPNDKGSL